MKVLSRIKGLFWNPNENRLRALWRLGLHTIILVVLSSVFILILFALTALADGITGTNLQQKLSGLQPMQMASSSWMGTVLIPGLTFLAVVLATLFIGKWIDKRKIKEFGILLNRQWWMDFVFGLLLGAFLMGMIFLFGWLTGNVQVTGYFQSFSESGSFLSGWIQSIILFIFVGFYEELLSRGYHLINLSEGFNHKFIGKRLALILAILVSSLIFGSLHLSNPYATWISTLNISLAGIFLGMGMFLTGSLAIPIGLHITWNFVQGNIFGFPVSGTSNGATLIATELVGPQWLTGGSFGPEAGILGLAAMLIGSGLIFIWVKRKGKPSLRFDLSEFHAPTNNSWL